MNQIIIDNIPQIAMEAVRKIVSADLLTPVIDLPWKTKNMQVEVIVFPLNEVIIPRAVIGKNLKGCLKEYANPDLWEKESNVWENHYN